MAQNITLLGASYSDVPAVQLPKTGGGTALFTDVTPTTASASDVASGKIFFDASGHQQTGTSSGGGGGGGIEITQDQQGFIVLPTDGGGGGGGGWTEILHDSMAVSTTSTTATVKRTYDQLPLFESGKLYYCKIRDNAGMRNGYYFGADEIFVVGTPTAINYGALWIYRVSTAGVVSKQLSLTNGSPVGLYLEYVRVTNGYGYSQLYAKYNSSYTLTIDGTYDIYLYEIAYDNTLAPF